MKSKILAMVAVGLLVGPAAANAGLIAGDQVTITFNSDPVFNATVPVNAGDDLSVGQFIFDFNSGLDGDIFSWVSFPLEGPLLGATSFTLSSLAFTDSSTLIGFNVTATLLTNVSITTTATSLTVNFDSPEFVGPGNVLIGKYLTAPKVPEPGTLGLLGLGLLGLGLARRKAA